MNNKLLTDNTDGSQSALILPEKRLIEPRQVNDTLIEQRLLIGGEREEAIARRLGCILERIDRQNAIPFSHMRFLRRVAGEYRKLRGRYFVYMHTRISQGRLWHHHLEREEERSDADLKWVSEIALGGIPDWESDFYLKVVNGVTRRGGKREALVTLHTMYGVNSGPLVLPFASLKTSSRFRNWLHNSISWATWTGTKRYLKVLEAEIGRQMVANSLCNDGHPAMSMQSRTDVGIDPDGGDLCEPWRRGLPNAQ